METLEPAPDRAVNGEEALLSVSAYKQSPGTNPGLCIRTPFEQSPGHGMEDMEWKIWAIAIIMLAAACIDFYKRRKRTPDFVEIRTASRR